MQHDVLDENPADKDRGKALEIRRADVREAETLMRFQIAMARETEDLTLDEEVVRAGVEAVFQDPSKGEYWVAVVEGKVVGGLLVTREWSDWRCGTVLWIHSVYVPLEARGRGIFRSMYAALRQRVEARDDLMGLRLYVEKANRSAQAVYDAVGMSREHYDLYEWLKDG